ncbi:hypothetical protein B0T21DRAFT_372923 [Apiosordaria backusii]|uniref:DUF7924 domain-containing protein n=1 Tax=Apiosordaria backusii TaxID=314023 RepID=A0AA40AXY9_9PEZI|nr:hypothetical protein B0T21DRAFT_372923 [Apiosordaria backusii]
MDAEVSKLRKRERDAAPEDPSPAKRARLTHTGPQQPGAEHEKVEQAAENTLLQPKPTIPGRLYASFLSDFVDPPLPHEARVSEWLESVGSDRENRCRSDSHLQHSRSNPISRKLTRSAPAMNSAKDADGFTIPPTPVSTGPTTYQAPYPRSITPSGISYATPGSGRSASRSLVENSSYRKVNLAQNNIYLRPLREQLPDHIARLIDDVRKDRDSPGPSVDQVSQDGALNALWMGAAETEVEEYFHTNIFPKPKPSDVLKRCHRQPMAKHTVPKTGSEPKVSNPVPDMLYGYTSDGAFTGPQEAKLFSMNNMVANSLNLISPFFAIEFKGDGPSGGGSMWVATNQCLGASASCVHIVECLNHQLRECGSDPVSSAAFSIAMNGTEARLYVSWKHDELDYYMAHVKSFLLHEPEHYIEFRKYVRNIIDWGKDKRLTDIRNSLDILLEESRKRASEAAKSRRPSDGSATSNGKKHKSSSSRQNSSTSSFKEHSRGANETHWTPDETAS